MKNFFGDKAQRSDSMSKKEKVTARQGEGQSSFTQTKVANDGSKSKQGDRDVFLAGKRAAEDTIQRQEVPISYRRFLRSYFEGMDPEAESNKE